MGGLAKGFIAGVGGAGGGEIGDALAGVAVCGPQAVGRSRPVGGTEPGSRIPDIGGASPAVGCRDRIVHGVKDAAHSPGFPHMLLEWSIGSEIGLGSFLVETLHPCKPRIEHEGGLDRTGGLGGLVAPDVGPKVQGKQGSVRLEGNREGSKLGGDGEHRFFGGVLLFCRGDVDASEGRVFGESGGCCLDDGWFWR